MELFIRMMELLECVSILMIIIVGFVIAMFALKGFYNEWKNGV